MKHNEELKGMKGIRTAFPKRLQLAYKVTGFTPKQIAARTNISVTALSNYKNGKQLPVPNNLEKLAKVFGCTIHWLYGIDNVNAPTARVLPEGVDPSLINLEEFAKSSTLTVIDIASSMYDADETGINAHAYRVRGDEMVLAKAERMDAKPNATPKDKKLLGDAIKARYKELGAKGNIAIALAETTRLSAMGISNIVRGFSWPRPINFILIATALRTTPEALEARAFDRLDDSRLAQADQEQVEDFMMSPVDMQAKILWDQAFKFNKDDPRHAPALSRWFAYCKANIPSSIDIDAIDISWLQNQPFYLDTYVDGTVDADFSCSDTSERWEAPETLAEFDRMMRNLNK